MKLIHALAAASLLAFGIPSTARAAPVEFNLVLDLDAVAAPYLAIFNGEGFSPISVHADVGDEVEIDIDFLGDQQLTASGINSVWAAALDQDGGPARFLTTGALSFVGHDGALLLTLPEVTNSNCCVHVGNPFTTGFPSTITFSGLRFVGTIDAQLEGSGGGRTYESGLLELNAHTLTYSLWTPPVGAGPVPEPSMWLLFLFGFGVAGAMLRSRSSGFAKAPSGGLGRWPRRLYHAG